MSEKRSENPLVYIVMGSKSDWEVMQHAAQTLSQFGVANECRVLSAHRPPAAATEFISSAEGRGVQVIRRRGGAHDTSGIGRADAERGPTGDGFPPFHGADAGRNPSRNAGDRKARGDQRGPAGNCDPGEFAPGTAGKAARLSQGTDAENS